jgi:hypothetical protein
VLTRIKYIGAVARGTRTCLGQHNRECELAFVRDAQLLLPPGASVGFDSFEMYMKTKTME